MKLLKDYIVKYFDITSEEEWYNKVKEIFQNKEDKNMQTRKGRHEISWWNRILFHRIHQ